MLGLSQQYRLHAIFQIIYEYGDKLDNPSWLHMFSGMREKEICIRWGPIVVSGSKTWKHLFVLTDRDAKITDWPSEWNGNSIEVDHGAAIRIWDEPGPWWRYLRRVIQYLEEDIDNRLGSIPCDSENKYNNPSKQRTEKLDKTTEYFRLHGFGTVARCL